MVTPSSLDWDLQSIWFIVKAEQYYGILRFLLKYMQHLIYLLLSSRYHTKNHERLPEKNLRRQMYVDGSTRFNLCDFGSWRVLFTIALWPIINVTVKRCHHLAPRFATCTYDPYTSSQSIVTVKKCDHLAPRFATCMYDPYSNSNNSSVLTLQ